MRTGLLLLLGLMHGFLASAQVYKWVDENGVTHYSQNKPEATKATKIKIKGMPDTDKKEPAAEAIAVDVDCEKVVRNNIKLMVEAFKAKSGNNSLVEALTDPVYIIEVIEECNREIKDSVKGTVWLCQQNATSVEEIEWCER